MAWMWPITKGGQALCPSPQMGHETLGYIQEIGSEAEKEWEVFKGDRMVVQTGIRYSVEPIYWLGVDKF